MRNKRDVAVLDQSISISGFGRRSMATTIHSVSGLPLLGSKARHSTVSNHSI